MRVANLQEMIQTLTSPTGSDVAVSDHVLGLKNRYDEPWRHHHNFEHPREMFGVLLDHSDVVRSLGTVGWAIMYHDVVYDPAAAAGRNEELSARLAESELVTVTTPEVVQRVAHYVRETAAHGTGGDDADLDLFLDIDLTILGADQERYDRYASNIWQEYVDEAKVPVEHYRLGRIAVLESLATRVEQRGLFRTDLFREIYEDQAQANIAREIEKLRRAD